MINFLVSICEDDFQPIWSVVGFIVKSIWFGVPVILIVLGMFDLGKAVITSKEEESKKAFKTFGRRAMYAVAVFLVFWLVKTILSFSARIMGNAWNDNDDNTNDKPTWETCWNMMMK